MTAIFLKALNLVVLSLILLIFILFQDVSVQVFSWFSFPQRDSIAIIVLTFKMWSWFNYLKIKYLIKFYLEGM